MEDLKISFNKHCTCIQKDCPIWGNCVLCVENHKVRKAHMPECMQEFVRESIAKLCQMVEYRPADTRPTAQIFATLDKPKFIRDAIAKHL